MIGIGAIAGAGKWLATGGIKKIGNFIGGLFGKKKRKRANGTTAASNTSGNSGIAGGFFGKLKNTLTGKTTDNQGWPDKVGEVLGDITAPSREITTTISPQTIGLIVGGALLLMFLGKK